MATSFYKLEAEFARKFAGKTLKNPNNRDNVVQVFVDYPDLLEGERKFPSISILHSSMSPVEDMYDTDMSYEVSNNLLQTPTTITERRIPEYYDIEYEVSCYSLSAFEDRELFRWIESKYAPRDYLKVDDIAYHVFRRSFSKQDDKDFDTIIYKKTWTYSIIADIEDVDNDVTSKAINEIRLKSNIVNNDLRKQADTAEKTLHRNIVFDDQSYWFKSK
jgi:hypothetical protein